ncbi:MAG: DUF4198 domain-containing protein [Elusimicrobiota bacterium]
MKKQNLTALSLVFSLSALVPGGLWGHSLWIEKHGEELILRYGHNPNTHPGEEQIPYAPDQIIKAECFKRSGEKIEFIMEASYPLTMNRKCEVAVVLTSSGYWSKTPFGLKRQPKNAVLSPLHSWLSYEGVKRIGAWDERLSRPLTQDLEIVPLRNPLQARKREKIRLLVTFNGIALSGVPVAYDGKTRGQTDKAGRINIRLQHPGRQLIEASFSAPGDKSKADEVIRTAALVFEIGALRELDDGKEESHGTR